MTLEVSLIAPEKLICIEQCKMVVIPAAEGDMGVLPQHMPMIVRLRPGVLRVFKETLTEVSQHYFLEGGVAHVSGTCKILAPAVYTFDELDHGQLTTLAANLQKDIQATTNIESKMLLEGDLRVVRAKLFALLLSPTK